MAATLPVMTEARINPAILSWALERSGIDAPALADKLGTPAARVSSWEAGVRMPTFRQAKRIAELTHIPFGYLYLAEPPEEPLPIADFRTVGDGPLKPLSTNFRELINDVLRKQAWFREYRQQQGEPTLDFPGRLDMRSAATTVAANMKRALKITAQDRAESGNWEDYLRLLIGRIEAAGVLVMRSGIVGNNTHRPLSVDEFRGFAIADELAPVIFLNARDAKAAQIFTVIHELAHIWLGASGISNERLGDVKARDSDIERQCNAAAAEFLVPAEELRGRWTPRQDFAAQVRELARMFKVSGIVIGRRAVELRFATWDEFSRFYESERRDWAAAGARRTRGGNAYKTLAVRNSKLLTKAVLESALEGRMLLRDAGSMLGISPAKLRQLADSVYGEK